MNDYIFTDFDSLQFDNYSTSCIKNPTRSSDFSEVHIASLYSSLQSAMDQEFQTQTNFASDTGLEYLDCSRWRNNLQVGNGSETMNLSTPGQETPTTNSEILNKSEQHTTAPSYELLQKLQESKLNLVLVATSLDQNDVLQKLENTLDPKTNRMIPLTFKDDKKDNVDVSRILDTFIPDEQELSESPSASDETENSNEENSDDGKKSKRTSLKRKQVQGKDEKYWKRRNSNNEAARRSREAKRARFNWIEARTKELEVENARLEEQLKTLRSKMSELEGRA